MIFSAHALGAELGRHAQRPAHAARRAGTSCAPIRSLKFFAAGVTFYGMATFEGPLLSIKSVNGLAHYTDWIIGHVHAGALGWNGFMAAGMFYWLVPRLYGTKLHSKRSPNSTSTSATFGILLYVVSMWVSGVTQGLMWRALNPDGALHVPDLRRDARSRSSRCTGCASSAARSTSSA